MHTIEVCEAAKQDFSVNLDFSRPIEVEVPADFRISKKAMRSTGSAKTWIWSIASALAHPRPTIPPSRFHRQPGYCSLQVNGLLAPGLRSLVGY
ncbi:hypothetical protein [Bradyrhizobium valentinum]|uniref:hypothetical protein n=1 Tax=Bradyrhizobium valentinum TaxID=1518501 RepID=UPI0018D1F9F9|nr:hypothetical protein [Bradyrhizobium valentinum]